MGRYEEALERARAGQEVVDGVGDGEGDGKGLARDKFEIWKLRSWPPKLMADVFEAQGRDEECWEQQKKAYAGNPRQYSLVYRRLRGGRHGRRRRDEAVAPGRAGLGSR